MLARTSNQGDCSWHKGLSLTFTGVGSERTLVVISYHCLSGKLWYLQHKCVGDTTVCHRGSDASVVNYGISNTNVLEIPQFTAEAVISRLWLWVKGLKFGTKWIFDHYIYCRDILGCKPILQKHFTWFQQMVTALAAGEYHYMHSWSWWINCLC